MSLRRDRGKAAFPPSSQNLGGAQTLIDEYRHMQKRLNAAQPSTIELAHVKHCTQDMTAAGRLSRNRAARRAATDMSAVEHINRVYHMHRRIEEHYSRSERLKDPWDTSVHPVYLRRNTNAYQQMLKEEMSAWRPSSAPAWARDAPNYQPPCSSSETFPTANAAAAAGAYCYGGGAGAPPGVRPPSRPRSRPRGARPASCGGAPRGAGGGGGGGGGDSYAGWSVGTSLPASFPKSSYAEALRTADRAAYRAALMSEVLAGRLYREADLRRLFAAFLRLAPLGDRAVVQGVIAELKQELDVRG